MSILAIFDELVNFETDVLKKTTEDIIIKLALGRIEPVVSARKKELINIYSNILGLKNVFQDVICLIDKSYESMMRVSTVDYLGGQGIAKSFADIVLSRNIQINSRMNVHLNELKNINSDVFSIYNNLYQDIVCFGNKSYETLIRQTTMDWISTYKIVGGRRVAETFEGYVHSDNLLMYTVMYISLKKLYSNFQVILNNFGTLESEFPPNIFLWKNIREDYNFETISSVTELSLPNVFVDKIKQLDIKYENLKKEIKDFTFERKKPGCAYSYVFENFDKIIAVLAKSLELDFNTI